MGRRLRYYILLVLWVVIVLLTARSLLDGTKASVINLRSSFDKKVDKILTGGQVGTKSHSVWELTEYKDVKLLRKSPMCWCPYKAYLEVQRHTHIENHDNKNWLRIDANLKALLKPDADFNKQYAKNFKLKGKTKRAKLKEIYRYCKKTTYTLHVKTAKDVFTLRQGDCSAIASAMYVLCKANKISVRYVIGWTDEGCHAWNRVKLGSTWYWVDACYGLWLNEEQFTGRKVMEIW